MKPCVCIARFARSPGEDGGSDGESLSGGSSGVAEGIQSVGGLPDGLGEVGHLGDSTGVVGDRAVSVGGQGDSEGGEHADGGNGDSVSW